MSQVTLNETNLVTYNLAIAVWLTYVLLKSPAQTKEVDLFASHRWERGLADLQTPVHGDSLIPMFESMVDRAFSRTHSDYAPKEKIPAPTVERTAIDLETVRPRIRRIQ
jgi:hypothetical protein